MKKKNNRSDETYEERRASKRRTRAGFSKFSAFWGVTFAAILFLVNGILQLLQHFGIQPEGVQNWMTGIDFVSKLLLLFAVAIPAYGYVNDKRIGWKIVYVAAIAFYACFCVLRLF